MNQEQAMARMRGPRDKKPEIWRKGVIQIHLGRACDLACTGCTQGSQWKGASPWMTPEQFETCVRALLEPVRFWGVIGVFGGNPCLSPHFEACCEILRRLVPQDQCGIWTNNARGKGAILRQTFNPAHSNLNVHTVREAWDEMARDWPESVRYLKGLDQESPVLGDSRHAPPWVAMQDLQDMTDDQRWQAVSTCDVNKLWSPMFYVMRGELRFNFCELAAGQAIVHQHEPDYPDLGRPVTPGVWHQPIQAFADQVAYHCMACSHPLRFAGDFAHRGRREYVSATHASIALPKARGREVIHVTHRAQLVGQVTLATNYIQNAGLNIDPPKRIDAITTCVGPYYAQHLERSLPSVLAETDTVTVVTMPEDPALAVCDRLKSPKLHVVTTPVFRELGAAFNKFAALNVGLIAMAPREFILHFDADTCLESGWRAKADPHLKLGVLGGVHRYTERGKRIADHPFGCGFVHVWHVDDPNAQPRPAPFEPWWPHAGHGDREFLERWNVQKKIVDLGFRAIHLGEPRRNWHGVGFGDEEDGRRRMAELHRIGLGEARFTEKPLEIPRPWHVKFSIDGRPEIVLLATQGDP